MPLVNYTLIFALQLRESAENFCQGGRVDCSLHRLGCLLRRGIGRLAEYRFNTVTRVVLLPTFGLHKCLQFAELRGSQHQLTLS